ncbi:MAG: glycosyltransferase [Sedimenticola sp.]
MTSVDVVLPARGHLPWIEDAMASIAVQTWLPGRVWLVDDGIEQPEQVDQACERILGERYGRVICDGQGISDALNTGIRNSRATWIARMDADDVAHPQRFSEQRSYLAKHQQLIACGTQIRFIDEKAVPLGESSYPVSNDEISSYLLERTCFCHPSLMLQRDALLHVPYRRGLDGAEDVDLMLRLNEIGEIGNLEQVLLDYRIGIHQSNFVTRARQAALQELAFRLAYMRRDVGMDPLDENPELVARFLSWRISQSGYADSRRAMIAARYLLQFIKGGEWWGSVRILNELLAARPWRPSVLSWVYRIARFGPGGLALDEIKDPGLVLLSQINWKKGETRR